MHDEGLDLVCRLWTGDPVTYRGRFGFTPAAATKLVNDLAQLQVQLPDGETTSQAGEYVEPVQLQVVCYRLYEQLAPGATLISDNDIEAQGDVNHALAEFYNLQVATIVAGSTYPASRIRAWFDQQLITPEGVRSQVLQGPDASGGLDNRIVAACAVILYALSASAAVPGWSWPTTDWLNRSAPQTSPGGRPTLVHFSARLRSGITIGGRNCCWRGRRCKKPKHGRLTTLLNSHRLSRSFSKPAGFSATPRPVR